MPLPLRRWIGAGKIARTASSRPRPPAIAQRGEFAGRRIGPRVGGLAVAVGDRATGEEFSLNLVYPIATVSASERQAMLQALQAEAQEIATLVDDPWHAARRAA